MHLIPLLVLVSLWAGFVHRGWGVRAGLLAAQVAAGVLTVLATETLGALRILTFWPLAAFWSTALAASLVWLRRSWRCAKFSRPSFSLAPLDIAVLIAIAVIVAVTGLVALAAPSNNCDSMSYHMARVAHWAHNATLANYPTGILRQLKIAPYAEYAILQGYILSGTDQYANLVQWSSMVTSLAGVSLIAGMLGGSLRTQLFSALFAATLPMGILQSTSTQNDYVGTLWAVCVVVFARLWVVTGLRRWAGLCALACGLAFLTKGIAMIAAAPFVAWALWRVRWRRRDKALFLLFVIAASLALNGAFLVRLTELAPNPFQAMGMGWNAMVQGGPDWRGAVSNAVRGMATELAAPFPGWNAGLLRAVFAVHRRLGIDVNDPRFTLDDSDFFLWDKVPMMEDFASSFAHFIIYLMAACYIVVLFALQQGKADGNAGGARRGEPGRRGPGNGLMQFLALFASAMLLLCVFVKWQQCGVRFHLPFFVIFSPLAAVALTGGGRRTWPALLACAWMLAGAAAPLLYNQQRPLLPMGAVTRIELAARVPHGSEIFDWLRRNGYFWPGGGREEGHLKYITSGMFERLRGAYPAEFSGVSEVLSLAPSFPGGILSASQEELLFGRFFKLSRDQIRGNLRFLRQRLQALPGCRDLGFISDESGYEYPFWSLFATGGHPVRIESVMVENVSRHFPYPRGEPDPCLLVKEGNDGPETIDYRGRSYRRVSPGPFQIYERAAR